MVPSHCRALDIGSGWPDCPSIRALNREFTAQHDPSPVPAKWTGAASRSLVNMSHLATPGQNAGVQVRTMASAAAKYRLYVRRSLQYVGRSGSLDARQREPIRTCRSRSRSVRRRSPSIRGRPCWSPNRTGRSTGPAKRGCISSTRAWSAAGALYANGEPWDLLNGGAITYHAARIFLTNRAFLTEDGADARPAPWASVLSRHARRRHARGHRHHQQRPEAGAVQPGDRACAPTSPTCSR